jgi:hypothetical protein
LKAKIWNWNLELELELELLGSSYNLTKIWNWPPKTCF